MIEGGIYKAVKQAPQVGERLLFRYEGKGAFGELALMYNCPRAATVVVNSRPVAVVHCYSKACCMPSVHSSSWLKTSAEVARVRMGHSCWSRQGSNAV